jgi:peroxiredoxin Q/BCP
MKKIFFIIVVVILTAIILNYFMSQSTILNIGDSIPKFTLKDQNNNDFYIDKFLNKKPLVIYFYPKDDTPGCTAEACSFRDAFEVFKDLDAEVIGISADDVNSHKNFAEKYGLQFTLLADTENKVRNLFGVPKSLLGLLPGRVTYIVDKTGTIIHIFNSQLQTQKHISKSLSILKQLK